MFTNASILSSFDIPSSITLFTYWTDNSHHGGLVINNILPSLFHICHESVFGLSFHRPLMLSFQRHLSINAVRRKAQKLLLEPNFFPTVQVAFIAFTRCLSRALKSWHTSSWEIQYHPWPSTGWMESFPLCAQEEYLMKTYSIYEWFVVPIVFRTTTYR